MIKGYDAIKSKIDDIKLKGYEASNKESNILSTLEIALEATARGIKFDNIDLKKSDAFKFKVNEETNSLIPSFKTVEGLGDIIATALVEEREKQEFISIEDIQKRTKLSSTVTDKMKAMKVFDQLPESNQLSLF